MAPRLPCLTDAADELTNIEDALNGIAALVDLLRLGKKAPPGDMPTYSQIAELLAAAHHVADIALDGAKRALAKSATEKP